MPTDNLDKGLHANRPDATRANEDKFWYSMDTDTLYVSVGSEWREIGGGSSGGSGIQNLGVIEVPYVNDSITVDLSNLDGSNAPFSYPGFGAELTVESDGVNQIRFDLHIPLMYWLDVDPPAERDIQFYLVCEVLNVAYAFAYIDGAAMPRAEHLSAHVFVDPYLGSQLWRVAVGGPGGVDPLILEMAPVGPNDENSPSLSASLLNTPPVP